MSTFKMSTFKVGDIVCFKKTSEQYRNMHYNPAQVNYVVERLEKPTPTAQYYYEEKDLVHLVGYKTEAYAERLELVYRAMALVEINGFKIGDKFRRTHYAEIDPARWKVHTVSEFVNLGLGPSCLGIRSKEDNQWTTFDKVEKYVEGESKVSKRYIVVKENTYGGLEASVGPFVHENLGAAEQAALKLANNNPGVNFYILETVSVTQVPKSPAPVIVKL